MTRQECERKLIELAEQMNEVYYQYNPDGDGIMALIKRDGFINVSDINVDSETNEITNWTLEGTKYSDGHYSSVVYDSMTISELVKV